MPADDKICEVINTNMHTIPKGIEYSKTWVDQMPMPMSESYVSEKFKDDKTCVALLFPKGFFDFSVVFKRDLMGFNQQMKPEAGSDFEEMTIHDEFIAEFDGFERNEKGFNDNFRRSASISEISTLTQIMSTIRRPAFIRKLVEQFTTKVMEDGEFMAAEWIWSDDIFERACDKEYAMGKKGLNRFDQIRLCIKARACKEKGDGSDLMGQFIKRMHRINQDLMKNDQPVVKRIFLTSHLLRDREKIEKVSERMEFGRISSFFIIFIGF